MTRTTSRVFVLLSVLIGVTQIGCSRIYRNRQQIVLQARNLPGLATDQVHVTAFIRPDAKLIAKLQKSSALRPGRDISMTTPREWIDRAGRVTLQFGMDRGDGPTGEIVRPVDLVTGQLLGVTLAWNGESERAAVVATEGAELPYPSGVVLRIVKIKPPKFGRD